jgi:hypothetical protein
MYHNDEEEGEESMDVSADDILPPDTVPSFSPRIEIGNIHENNVVHDSDEDVDSERDEGDMSITGDFGPGIISRRLTMSLAGRDRRRSRMRSSITIPPSETGMEAKEFTVSVDRPLPPETDAFKALEAIANRSTQGNDDGIASEDGEADMDVSTAVTRLLTVKNSTGGQPPVRDSVEDSFSSTEDSFDGVDAGDRTVNVTNLMGSFRAPEYDKDDVGDVTMSATSAIGAPVSMSPAPVYATDDGAIESVEHDPENTPSLSATQVQKNIEAGQWASTIHGEAVLQEDALVSYHVPQTMQSTSLTMLIFPVGPHLCRPVFHHNGDPLHGRYDVPASFHRTSFAAPAARVQS